MIWYVIVKYDIETFDIVKNFRVTNIWLPPDDTNNRLLGSTMYSVGVVINAVVYAFVI